jgi:hypothetical protein
VSSVMKTPRALIIPFLIVIIIILLYTSINGTIYTLLNGCNNSKLILEGEGYHKNSPDGKYTLSTGSLDREVNINVTDQIKTVYEHHFCINAESVTVIPYWENNSTSFTATYSDVIGDIRVGCTYRADILTKEFTISCKERK